MKYWLTIYVLVASSTLMAVDRQNIPALSTLYDIKLEPQLHKTLPMKAQAYGIQARQEINLHPQRLRTKKHEFPHIIQQQFGPKQPG